MTKFINWLRGYLCIHINGTAPERFINLCCNKKIAIWNLQQIADKYQFYIRADKFKSLKPIAKKTGNVPKIQSKMGFPFYLQRYRKRKGFFAGIVFCIVLVYTLSLFIWDINVIGGSKYTPVAMLDFLRENQIYAGIKKKDIDCQEIEENIRLAYHDIGWVSAEIKGTRLIIKITETNMPVPAQKAIEPSHMIATKNAIIKSMITRSGTPQVKEGDVVKKGDILVSGIISIKSDFDEILSMQPTLADADIICKSYYDYSKAFHLSYQGKRFTGKKKKGYYVSVLSGKLFLYNPRYSYDNYDIIVYEKPFCITESFCLPLRFGTVSVREYTEETRKYTREEALARAETELGRYLKRLQENNVTIIENNVNITIENNYCIAEGRILVEEPAWEYKTIIEDEWRIPQTDEHSGNDN